MPYLPNQIVVEIVLLCAPFLSKAQNSQRNRLMLKIFVLSSRFKVSSNEPDKDK